MNNENKFKEVKKALGSQQQKAYFEEFKSEFNSPFSPEPNEESFRVLYITWCSETGRTNDLSEAA